MSALERNRSIDMIRGFAIATMMVLNLLGVVLSEPAPFVLRLVGSLAAPLFIILSGFMVSVTADRHNFGYFLFNRGAWIVSVGMFIDLVVWQIYPLMSMEVLYLIGISIPVAYVACKLKFYHRVAVALCIFILTPILQEALGYTYFPSEFYLLSGAPVLEVKAQTGIINHWLVDGWFPICPWLAFSIIGVELGETFKRVKPNAFNSALVYIGSALTVFGGSSFIFAYPRTFARCTWSELFYPPTIQYVTLAIGVSLLIFRFFIGLENRRLSLLLQPLGTLGRFPLGIYFAHLFTISYFITWASRGWWKMNLGWYLISYSLLLLAMWVIAKLYLLLGHKGKRWVSRISRGLVLMVLLAAVVALMAGYFPPLSTPIRIVTGFPFL